jgi:hypothetical protein
VWVWSWGDGEAFKAVARCLWPGPAQPGPARGLACADYARLCDASPRADAATRSAILPAITPPGTIIYSGCTPTTLAHREGRRMLQECLPASLSICRRCLQIVRSSFARLCESFIPGCT